MEQAHDRHMEELLEMMVYLQHLEVMELEGTFQELVAQMEALATLVPEHHLVVMVVVVMVVVEMLVVVEEEGLVILVQHILVDYVQQ